MLALDLAPPSDAADALAVAITHIGAQSFVAALART
jgi:Holliday junction resolvasome RuvABC endonuclease subunit